MALGPPSDLAGGTEDVLVAPVLQLQNPVSDWRLCSLLWLTPSEVMQDEAMLALAVAKACCCLDNLVQLVDIN